MNNKYFPKAISLQCTRYELKNKTDIKGKANVLYILNLVAGLFIRWFIFIVYIGYDFKYGYSNAFESMLEGH